MLILQKFLVFIDFLLKVTYSEIFKYIILVSILYELNIRIQIVIRYYKTNQLI
jgi:hypothetical protein